MSKKIVLMDDIDGSEAEGTLVFALEGAAYEIDLSGKNADKLRKALQPYVDVARRTGYTGRNAATTTKKRAASGVASDQVSAVRAWAQSQGIAVNSKGRIPKDVMLAFEQAHLAGPTAALVEAETIPEFSAV